MLLQHDFNHKITITVNDYHLQQCIFYLFLHIGCVSVYHFSSSNVQGLFLTHHF